jgi:Ferritin-like domain
VDTTALGENSAASRRRFLRAVGLGGTLAALPVVARTASAQSGSTTAPEAPAAPATTTTAPPLRPTSADVQLLGFAQSVELAAVDVYDILRDRMSSGDLSVPDETVQVVEVFREHHQAYAQSLSGILGRSAPAVANAALLVTIVGPFETGTIDEALSAAYDLENVLVATNLSILDQLIGTSGAAMIASIFPVEAKHAIVLGTMIGQTDLVPASGVESTDEALTPDQFPVERT